MDKKFNFIRRLPFTLKVLAGVLLGLLGLTAYQYVSMRRTAKELALLKEDYRTYLMGLRRMLREKTERDTTEPESDVKKKSIADTSCTCSGVYRACSNHPAETFFVVNRDPDYLKLHALHYTREEKVGEHKPATIVRSRKRVARRRVMPSRQKILHGSARHLSHMPEVQAARQWERDFIFHWPIERSKFWLSSRFGPRNMGKLGWRFHAGIDMAANRGTPVLAAASGIVVQSGWCGGYGKCIVIMHNKKYKTRYAHLSKRYVEVGEKVESGAVIGAVGDTGFVKKKGIDASHLHFEVYSFGRHINPLSVLT